MSNVLQNLKAARDLISDPTRWTRNEYARLSDGSGCLAVEEHAVCYCATGALWKVTGNSDSAERELLKEIAIEIFGILSPITVNDTLGHRSVLKMYDHAIAKAGAQAAP